MRHHQFHQNQFILLIVLVLLFVWLLNFLAVADFVLSCSSSIEFANDDQCHRSITKHASLFDTSSNGVQQSISGTDCDQQSDDPNQVGGNTSSLSLNVDDQLQLLESKLQSLKVKEYATGIIVKPMLGEGLYLVGA